MKLSVYPSFNNQSKRIKKGEKAMKRNLYIILAIMLMASFTLAAAGGRSTHIKGVIAAIDPETQIIIVNNIQVQVTQSTKICEYFDGTTCTSISFSDLGVGDRVNVTGQYSLNILYANKIVVH
jgi:Na+-transporting NADH:ubiquinone oxidoreductase subunit NqrC